MLEHLENNLKSQRFLMMFSKFFMLVPNTYVGLDMGVITKIEDNMVDHTLFCILCDICIHFHTLKKKR
jgi:hypothetical protein